MIYLARNNAILPFKGALDLTGKEGCLVIMTSTGLELATDPAEEVFGVILNGAPAGELSTVAVAAGGLAGTVKVKLADTVTEVGTLLMAGAGDGGAVVSDAGATSKVCALALETGVTGERIEAAIFKPVNA